MSILSSLWKPIQSIAKPFVAQIPLVGPLAASRINMSPTAAQADTNAALTPTANDVAKQIQNALEQERISNAKAAESAQRARDELAAAEAARRSAIQAAPTSPIGAGAPMGKDQMMLYGGIAAAILLVLVLGNRR